MPATRTFVLRLRGLAAPATLLAALLAAPPRAALAQPPEGRWTHLSLYGGTPLATTGGWSVFDSRRGRFLHHPGSYYQFFPRSGPIYTYPGGTYSIRTDAWTPWSLIANDDNLPPAEMSAAVYDSAGDRVLVYGGLFRYGSTLRSASGYVYQLDLGSGAGWGWLVTLGTPPPRRYDASLVLDSARHRLLLYGGVDSSGQTFGDVWELPLTGSPVWAPLSPTGTPPPARHAHLAAYDPARDRMVIACGEGAGGAMLSDTWELALSSPPVWTPLSPAGPAPDGATIGALDAENDRLLAISSGDPVRQRTLALAPGGAWDSLRVTRAPPTWNWSPPPAPYTYPERMSAAFDPLARQLLAIWGNGAGAGQTTLDAPLLRLGPLAAVQLTAALPLTTFQDLNTSLYWNLLCNRPPYDRVSVETFLGTVPYTGQITTTGYPDSLGSFAMSQYTLQPGARYGYRVHWFDGASDLTTGDFFVDTPPPPLDIGWAMDSVVYAGRSFRVRFVAPDDSARMLSTETFQRRIPPAPWESVWDPALPRAVDWWPEETAIPDTVYEYRLLWGDPAARQVSAPYAVRSLPEPVFQSIAATPGAVDIRWSIRPGYPFTGRVYRFPNGIESLAIPVGDVTAAADGSLHETDHAIEPQTTYIYYLTWIVGGIELRDTGYFVTTSSGGQPGAGGAFLADVVNPAEGAISFTVLVGDDSPASVDVFDLTGRLRMHETFPGPGSHPFRIEGPSWKAGIYLLRISHAGQSHVSRVALVR